MLRTQPGLRVLGPSDLPDVLGLLATDPVRNAVSYTHLTLPTILLV